MIHTVDWASKPPPWNRIGPASLAALRAEVKKIMSAPPRLTVQPLHVGESPEPSEHPIRQKTYPELDNPKRPPPPQTAFAAKPTAASKLRICPDCTWSGPSDEYAHHRWSDHA
jgi:hypothetical protein